MCWQSDSLPKRRLGNRKGGFRIRSRTLRPAAACRPPGTHVLSIAWSYGHGCIFAGRLGAPAVTSVEWDGINCTLTGSPSGRESR